MPNLAPIASFPGPEDPVGEGLGPLRRRFTAVGPPSGGPAPTHRKVAIVGCGAVGMACAMAILHRGCLEELVLVDVATERLEGEVMDLCHGMPFLPRADVRAGRLEQEGRDADLVVVTAGVAQQPGQSRLELIEANAGLFRQLVPAIAEHCPRAVLLVLSNPVDPLTYIAGELSGFPHHRVLGSGTVLDSARFRMAISRRLGLDPHDVQAWVIGEHGDSEVPVWSRVAVGGLGLFDDGSHPQAMNDPELWELFDREVRQAAAEIIRRKGSTSWAIGLATAEIVEAVLRSKEQVLTVSTRVGPESDLPDVSLSLPTVVNHSGAVARLRLALSTQERLNLERSALLLRQTLDAVGI
ncbi:MAG: L-lactate dehydrogenase [Prochlorococcaceae cyanobacterium]